jgi:hypothetical protein
VSEISEAARDAVAENYGFYYIAAAFAAWWQNRGHTRFEGIMPGASY